VAGERFKLIQGGKAKEPKRRPKPKPWEGCFQCEIDIGVRTRSLVTVTTSPEVTAKGDIVGGTKSKVCAFCMARGKYTKHSI
jgi:hypothetical protein